MTNDREHIDDKFLDMESDVKNMQLPLPYQQLRSKEFGNWDGNRPQYKISLLLCFNRRVEPYLIQLIEGKEQMDEKK